MEELLVGLGDKLRVGEEKETDGLEKGNTFKTFFCFVLIINDVPT